MQRTAKIRLPVLALVAAYVCPCWQLAAGSAAASPDNPCRLLTAAEVEAVPGEPLAGPPFRVNGDQPSASGPACRYETKVFRAVKIEVDWSHRNDTFRIIDMASGIADAGGLKGVLKLSDGTELQGSWNKAAMSANSMRCTVISV